jgi:hypothetical protein
MPGQSSRRSKSSRRRLRRNRLVFEGPGAEDGLAVLDRRLRVPAREGMPREEAILEEPGRRHVEVIGCQKLQNHHSTRALSSLGLCSHEQRGWRCGAAQCCSGISPTAAQASKSWHPVLGALRLSTGPSPRDLHPASVIHHRSIYGVKGPSLCARRTRPLRLTG